MDSSIYDLWHIALNVMQNPIFQDALMCTAKKGFILPDYNKIRTEYVDKVKQSTEAILKRTVLIFLPMFGCTIALDGWTSCQKNPLINVMCVCPRGSMFVEAIDSSLKEKTITYLTRIYGRMNQLLKKSIDICYVCLSLRFHFCGSYKFKSQRKDNHLFN